MTMGKRGSQTETSSEPLVYGIVKRTFDLINELRQLSNRFKQQELILAIHHISGLDPIN